MASRCRSGQDQPVELRNWAGNIAFSTDRLHAPASLDELQQLVADSSSIRALGTGHSFNRIADTRGDLVTVRDLAGEIVVGTDTVSVPAGARYGEVAGVLQAAGFALGNLGSLPHISVAGACATGTHGSGAGNKCLAASVRAVEFVRADGELVSVAAGDPAFGGSVLALGALGIVTRLELVIEKSFDVRQDVWLDAPLDAVAEQFDEIMAAGYSVSLFIDPVGPDLVAKIWVKTRGPDAVDGIRWGARAATQAQHPTTGQDPSAATEQFGVAGPWHERLPHFRLGFTPSSGDEQQSEFLIPREHGAAALLAVRRLDLSDALQVSEVRTIAADDLWLSPCQGRDTVGLHFTWFDDDEKVHAAVAAVERALAPFDPRPHWGKVFLIDPVDHYPKLPEFRALAGRHDPNRKFGNDFLDRYVYR